MKESEPETNKNNEEDEDWIESAQEEIIIPETTKKETEEKEPKITIETGGSDEDEEYNGPNLEPYNPKLDLENYHLSTKYCSIFAGALFLNEPMTHGLLFGAVLILVGIRQVTK